MLNICTLRKLRYISELCVYGPHVESTTNGPNFVPSLFDALIGFRCHRITLTADIEKAFVKKHVCRKLRGICEALR